LQAFFDVISRKSLPDDIGDVAGNVVENSRVNRQIVREGEKSDARTDARADDADFFVALLFQPANGARVSTTDCLKDCKVRPTFGATR
jgi:hypothetical protein